ncbi:hypothetical protein Slin15195_G069780 [Septoria linicola]|uniref:Uncharacterized protein n=1 Tax=Septoria linicola TaxID=215465 RepID=A0A9Q9AQN3_9PEZI|nr:hypothetical protein Slin15195_G069780 [Septoria linicola]
MPSGGARDEYDEGRPESLTAPRTRSSSDFRQSIRTDTDKSSSYNKHPAKHPYQATMKLLSLLLALGATTITLASPILYTIGGIVGEARAVEARSSQKCTWDKDKRGAAGNLCYGPGVKNSDAGYC